MNFRYPVYVYDDFGYDIALSTARRRKIQKEIERIEDQFYGIQNFKKNCDATLSNISSCVRQIDSKVWLIIHIRIFYDS